MLVRDGRLSAAQVDAAVAQQARVGGRFGTVLIEMRLLDADTLTLYLGLALGIPVATRAALDRAKRAAVRLLTPELAERLLVVPLVVQDRQLIAAMRDPHDLLALDELATATGYRIIPRVAPEARLHYYVERYYGVARPERFRALGELVSVGPPRGGDYMEPPPAPLPGLPPKLPNPVRAPSVPPPIRTVTASGTPIEDDLAIELEAAADEPAEEAAPRTSSERQVVLAHRAPVAPTPEEILSLDAAVARMNDAGTRSEIADAIVGHARGLFDVAVLLVVRDELAFGWKGFAPGVDLDRIETLLLPLGGTSIFHTAIEAADLLVTTIPPTALHAHLYRVLRAHPPRQAAVMPVVIRDRVVNLLYGHRDGDWSLSDASAAALRELAQAASAAYVRLIAQHKRAG